MDLIFKNARLIDGDGEITRDIGVTDGMIVAIARDLGDTATRCVDVTGRLAVPGFVESHIHLDKACLLDRCRTEEGTLAEAIREVAEAKKRFTVDDIRARAARTLDKCIAAGTTRMRTHLEVDPGIGLKSLDAIMPLVEAYRWAIDIEICVFPQEGLCNRPGTDALMIEALERGATVIGGCPYTDSEPLRQIARIFEIARDFDVDIDFHLDFDTSPEQMTIDAVCSQTQQLGWEGRVTVGHVSKLSALPTGPFEVAAKRMAQCGVAVTVLPSTDLFLMGADRDHDVVRGVAPAHRLLPHGVTCALSTNNVLNPFTPFGDCSMVRMANLYANIGRLGSRAGHRHCLEMITGAPASLMRLADYGFEPGHPADLVVLDCGSAQAAVQEIATPLFGYKNGRRTFTRAPVELHRP